MTMKREDAIVKVLEENGGPLHYSEIAERAVAKGYYDSKSANPAHMVFVVLASSIRSDDSTPFVRIGDGVYGLRNLRSSKRKPVPGASRSAKGRVSKEIDEDDPDAATIIRAFGMYWQRDLVVWKNEPKLFGKQQALSTPVDFGGQKGLYILYDHHTVVYVGRTTDRPLGRRLYEHTTDRLGSRWNRFSWFGFMDVTQDGRLRDIPVNSTMDVLVPTLEALLIEALEPPQNRRRGDGLSGFEYIQDLDPEIKERELQNTLRNIERKLREGA